MRALLINGATISSVTLGEDTLASIQEHCQTNTVTGLGYPDAHHAAWADDEILLRTPDDLIGTPINVYPWYGLEPVLGPVLITGFDPETGDTTPATMLVSTLAEQFKHFGLVTERMFK